jgi:hypothetical protein
MTRYEELLPAGGLYRFLLLLGQGVVHTDIDGLGRGREVDGAGRVRGTVPFAGDEGRSGTGVSAGGLARNSPSLAGPGSQYWQVPGRTMSGFGRDPPVPIPVRNSAEEAARAAAARTGPNSCRRDDAARCQGAHRWMPFHRWWSDTMVSTGYPPASTAAM